MADTLIIPMVVLAENLKSARQVPAINPDYKTALSSYLGKDSTPPAFNKNILLKKGVHLHFILPSALKKGTEIQNSSGEKVLEYPAVPDRFIVTRAYVYNGKIETSCNIVESNFYSLDDTYNDSITIPKFDDVKSRHRFRYMGRTYPGDAAAPAPVGESGYFDKITALGGGDPVFSAYYPSCSSVFGFYDSLDGVPSNAVLTYFVIGYYSNPENDILHGVSNAEEMAAVLEQYGLSAEENPDVCSKCVLFGEIGGIDLSKDSPPPVGEINVGIGRTSEEALSAIIKDIYYEDKPDMERFLTSLQYDTIGETQQPDGNFKIDDDIHYRGFTRIDPIETAYAVDMQKNEGNDVNTGLMEQYSALMYTEQEIGRLRRLLDSKKNSLYYLWELYMDAPSESEEEAGLKKLMDPLMSEIASLREKITKKISDSNISDVKAAFAQNMTSLKESASEPFYLLKDPAVMLSGDGMNRSYAFGEDGRFEDNNTLYCLTKPIDSDIADTIRGYLGDLHCCDSLFQDYGQYAVMAVLLDTDNILARLQIDPKITEKYSPVMYNNAPMEQVTLLMQWETEFYPNYSNSNPADSSLIYGNTDYIYKGDISGNCIRCNGATVLTPHGVYNLQNKLKKYIEAYSDTPGMTELAGKIKDLASVSQNLSGFSINMTALQHAYQFPIDIDNNDGYSKAVAKCIQPSATDFYEPPPERLAVRNNSQVFPLREGFFNLSKLALATTFGDQRKIIDDEFEFKGKRYYSENLQPVKNNMCFLPLGVTTAARLCVNFMTASDNRIISSPFPEATPVIGIFLPDMLNRNLNVFNNSGESIGIIKTAYRVINGKKTVVGRFVPSPCDHAETDPRIMDLIAALTQDNTAFAEVMAVIDHKLNKTLPLAQNDFIFGRALVLAEMSVALQFFGEPEWSKLDADIGSYKDMGLSEQAFPVMFGDADRATDGVCCGFYDDFSHGFAAFGAEDPDALYLNKPDFCISSVNGIKNVTLLFDPMLNVTINTGILPVKQLSLYGEHTDFSKFSFTSFEMNTLISGEEEAELPDFTGNNIFTRFYPEINGSETVYRGLNIVSPYSSVSQIRNTIITDGIITERNVKYDDK